MTVHEARFRIRYAGRTLPLPASGGFLVAGADPSCDLQLQEEDEVSRVHARFTVQDDAVRIERLSTLRPVKVDGQPLRRHEVRRVSEATVELGRCALLVEPTEPIPQKRRALRVMVIDDDDFALEVAAGFLEAAGHHVTQRSSAFGATHAILKARPHVLLLDVNIPGLSGPSLAEVLAAQSTIVRICVIFYSGMERDALDRLVNKHGVAGGIVKTHDEADFLRQFNAILDVAL